MSVGFTDIHHHLLYGLDDGPKDAGQMQVMLREAFEQGINRIVVTPHMTPGVDTFDKEEYLRRLEEARNYVADKKYCIEILSGAEIMFSDSTCRFLQEGKALTLNDEQCVLVEFSPLVKFDELLQALRELVCTGYMPVLAHVERYRCLVSWPSRAEKLKKEIPVYYQLNCSAVLGKAKGLTRIFVNKMLRDGLIDAVATDAHNVSNRKARMAEAWQELEARFGAEYADWLTNGHIL